MKTLVTGALQASEAELKKLEALGLEIVLQQNERDETESPEQFEAVICNGLFLHNDIEKFENLKYIQLTSAGTDRVPAEYIREHGIALYNAAGVYAVPMAEWTLMRLLELYKNAEKLFAEKGWVKDRSWRELAGKTACLVGFGAYGAEVAKRLKAFDVRVCAVNRSAKESTFVDAFYPMDRLDEALGCADIVIMTIALTEDTRHLMNAERFAAMKPGAVFLNAARGALVDESALIEALGGSPTTRSDDKSVDGRPAGTLVSGKLAGAALDVFETEPLPDESPLRGIKNLLISPHNSFVGENNHARLMSVVMRNITAEKNEEL